MHFKQEKVQHKDQILTSFTSALSVNRRFEFQKEKEKYASLAQNAKSNLLREHKSIGRYGWKGANKMEKLKEKFNLLFESENKEETVQFILDKLKNKEIDVIDLYMNILTPALNHMKCNLEDKYICIWKEHVKTAIVRTIVECCFPYVIEKKNEMNCGNRGTVVVLCPPEEYHDLGARMVSDFFTMCGCNSIFIGSNTPYEDFYNAIHIIRPSIVAISVSNYYNLVVTKKMIEDLKKIIEYPLKIVVGGNAFHDDLTKFKKVGADYYAISYQDIVNIVSSEVTI